MDRKFLALVAALAFSFFLSDLSLAQPPSTPGGQSGRGGPGPSGGPGGPGGPGPSGGPGVLGAPGGPRNFGPGPGFRRGGEGRFKAARERWQQLSPEERQRFQQNAERWLQMGPEQRKIMRDREVARRQRLKLEAEMALKDSGLRLEPEKRDLYEHRYIQERRRIEQSLRQELEEKRRQQLAPVVERLKKEFEIQQGSPGASASPAGSAPQKK